MPRLFIHTVNSDFQSRDGGDEYDRPEDAMAAGMRGALEIIGDEVQKGKTAAAVDIRIQSETGEAVLRSVVALSISPLMTEAQQARHPGVDPSVVPLRRV